MDLISKGTVEVLTEEEKEERQEALRQLDETLKREFEILSSKGLTREQAAVVFYDDDYDIVYKQ